MRPSRIVLKFQYGWYRYESLDGGTEITQLIITLRECKVVLMEMIGPFLNKLNEGIQYFEEKCYIITKRW